MIDPSVARARAMRRPRLSVLLAAASPLVLAAGAQAQDGTALPELVVTATRIPTPAREVASSVSVVTAEEIERRQLRTLPDVLRELPGLNMVQGGGAGGQASLFLRGTNSNHTKVLIDGIDASDPSTPTGAFDFAHLLTADIERVEVLRGPQSGLYGSDAIGGVVNIVTKKGKGPLEVHGGLEAGSFETFNQQAGFSGSKGRFSYAADLAHFRSADIPVTPKDLVPPGGDRTGNDYENTTFSGRFGADLTDTLSLGLVTRYTDAELQFTGDDLSVFPSVPASEQSETRIRQLFTRASATHIALGGDLEQTLGLAFTGHERRDRPAEGGESETKGDRVRLDWQADYRVIEGQILTFGAEVQREQIDDSPISAETNSQAGFVQLQSSFDDRFFNTASLRYDHNSRFGSEVTWRIAPAVLFKETGTKLKGSVGTAYKAPTLNQLFVSFPSFNFFSNPDLNPEKSFGWEVGIEQELLDERLRMGVTYFRNDIEDLINSTPDFTSLENVNRATTEGVETFVAVAPHETVDIKAHYTYTKATDDETGDELLRRPTHKAGLTGQWRPLDGLSLDAEAIYVGAWVDANRSFTVPRLDAESYTVVNVAASYAVTEEVTVFGRVTNLLDENYENPVGFEGTGIGAFAGVRLRF
ncbi:TonB-dependent receptor plug domain-containing protein [Marinimicrococcus flavescens]|uniref:TonB-dependent receptor n=1 Tax=Marinimicrococcus flavescens TaxID=3031815 RepID=A0AAP4D747_9PROT|nr:TonB-dependent receptor [Marinimicrococcus flavescens]